MIEIPSPFKAENLLQPCSYRASKKYTLLFSGYKLIAAQHALYTFKLIRTASRATFLPLTCEIVLTSHRKSQTAKQTAFMYLELARLLVEN